MTWTTLVFTSLKRTQPIHQNMLMHKLKMLWKLRTDTPRVSPSLSRATCSTLVLHWAQARKESSKCHLCTRGEFEHRPSSAHFYAIKGTQNLPKSHFSMQITLLTTTLVHFAPPETLRLWHLPQFVLLNMHWNTVKATASQHLCLYFKNQHFNKKKSVTTIFIINTTIVQQCFEE